MKKRNSIKWVDAREKWFIVILVLWLFRHNDRFGLPKRSRDEVLKFFETETLSLAGSAELIRQEDMPTQQSYNALLRERQTRQKDVRRRTASAKAEPTPEERAQIDALLAKYPNLIQRSRTNPTLF